MKSPVQERILWPVLTVALTAVLIVLGTLQYRWSKEVSEATTTRLRATLSSSMLAFRQDFARELSSIITAFQSSEEIGLSTELKQEAEQFRQWKKATSHPGLVKAVYVAEQAADHQLQLSRFDQAESGFESTSWPAELNNLRGALTRIITEHHDPVHFLPRGPLASGREPHRQAKDHQRFPDKGLHSKRRDHGPESHNLPHREDEHSEIARQQGPSHPRDYFFQPYETARPGQRPLVGGRLMVGQRGRDGNARDRRFMRRTAWFIDASAPALISPIVSTSFVGEGPAKDSVHWIIVELDEDFLRAHLFPELTARYFPGSNTLGYDVAVVSDETGIRNIYASSRPLSGKGADARLDLFGPSGPPLWMASSIPQFQNGQKAGSAPIHGPNFVEPPLLPAGIWIGSGNWQLVVKNRQGSLEAAASGVRRRQLTLSFGILAVLAGTMGLVVLASRRARNLARLQIDFVAGVSHELRTPLAVISSAAENIADGLVENKQQLSRYGNVIKSQSAQLKYLVEQILLFSSSQHGGQRYNLQPADPAVVIDLALENTSEIIHNGEITVEKKIEGNLPPVLVDSHALAQCLQNLITNAVKYGGVARWIGVTARQQSGRAREVTITISDRGIGIGPEELKSIFDPFYRGEAVRMAQIHGNGLGLPLARSIVEAMCGRITVESTPGKGSSFAVRLPVAAAASAGDPISAAVNPKRLIETHE